MKIKKSALKEMIKKAVLEQTAAGAPNLDYLQKKKPGVGQPAANKGAAQGTQGTKVATDVAAAQKKQQAVSGLGQAQAKINNVPEGTQAIVGAVKAYGLNPQDQIKVLTNAINLLRKEGGQAQQAQAEALDPVGKEDEDVDNDGKIDASDEYLKNRRGVIGKSMKEEGADESAPYDRHEHGYRKSTSWGEIPSPDELYELMDGDAFDMMLQGSDSIAFDYAMDVSENPLAGSLEAGDGMHATLQALVNVPSPDELTDEQYEDVERTLDRWYDRYGDEDIVEHAQSVASSIMDVLGVEWI